MTNEYLEKLNELQNTIDNFKTSLKLLESVKLPEDDLLFKVVSYKTNRELDLLVSEKLTAEFLKIAKQWTAEKLAELELEFANL